MRHGGPYAYKKLKCRCEVCRAWNAADALKRRGLRAARARAGQQDTPHGVGGYTNYACRCAVCTAAVRDNFRAYRQGGAS